MFDEEEKAKKMVVMIWGDVEGDMMGASAA
jgi:hypothetical protein